MKILLDESVPKALGYELQGHFVRTVQFAGMAGFSNGALLANMGKAGYDVLITFDQNLPYQQNDDLPVRVIVLQASNNRVSTALAFVPQILRLLDVNFESPEKVVRLSLN